MLQVKKPQGIIKWVHYFLAGIYTLFCIGGAISSLRGIIVLANTFKVSPTSPVRVCLTYLVCIKQLMQLASI